MSEIVAALAGIGGIVLGWYLKSRTESTQAVRDRNVSAARQLLEVIDEAVSKPENEHRWDSTNPRQADFRDTNREVRRLALEISDKSARTRLERVATSFFNYEAAAEFANAPSRIAHVAMAEAHSALGAVLREEPIPEATEQFTSMWEAIQGTFNMWAEEADAQRRD